MGVGERRREANTGLPSTLPSAISRAIVLSILVQHTWTWTWTWTWSRNTGNIWRFAAQSSSSGPAGGDGAVDQESLLLGASEHSPRPITLEAHLGADHTRRHALRCLGLRPLCATVHGSPLVVAVAVAVAIMVVVRPAGAGHAAARQLARATRFDRRQACAEAGGCCYSRGGTAGGQCFSRRHVQTRHSTMVVAAATNERLLHVATTSSSTYVLLRTCTRIPECGADGAS